MALALSWSSLLLLACEALQHSSGEEELVNVGENAGASELPARQGRSDASSPDPERADPEDEPTGENGGSSDPGDAVAGDAAAGGAASLERELPAYYDFVSALLARGFAFMDFDRFWRADKAQLPDKLIVVRHDVHLRDIAAAYPMRDIERALLGEGSATYFVMLGFPPESHKARAQQKYLDLIEKLKAEAVDVEPHISADDLYVSTYAPDWGHDSLKQLESLTAGDYAIEQYGDGIEVMSIPHDPLDIRLMNARLVDVLKTYNARWTTLTGLQVKSYASHGSQLPLNVVLNNAIVLDQRELIESGAYEFDAYNTRVMAALQYLSDNDLPDWMDHPDRVADGRYQLLAHPRQWTAEVTARRLAAEAAAASAAAGGAGGGGGESDDAANGGANPRPQ